jgi:fluoride exporter
MRILAPGWSQLPANSRKDLGREASKPSFAGQRGNGRVSRAKLPRRCKADKLISCRRWSSPEPPVRADDSYTLRLEFIVQTVLLISAGAILGANLRYFLAQFVTARVGSSFPLGTLIINISASFILGFFLIWTTERVLADPRWRIFVAIGFCATYSTYSSYAFETFALFERGEFGRALLNVLITNVVCFIAVALGAALARSL